MHVRVHQCQAAAIVISVWLKPEEVLSQLCGGGGGGGSGRPPRVDLMWRIGCCCIESDWGPYCSAAGDYTFSS